ncbi:hypothetical protein GGS21DRAFT_347509 [Xylaria nigripes]|nr:hypothetical protein GGS21DRAFT_347509 [Xylaria nigripes]
MRGLQRYVGCAGLLAVALLAMTTGAMPDDDGEQHELYWVEKSLNTHRHVKRREVCPQASGWSLCPASVGGGCCPDNFTCEKKSCYAATIGPTSCGGLLGFYGCPLTAGAGCCPVNWICGVNNCVLPSGVVGSISCESGLSKCPDNLGGGCCPDGFVCGTNVCLDNSPKTLPVSETKTTTDSSGRTTVTVVTSTVVITDEPNTSNSARASLVPQIIPSTVSKVSSIPTGDSGRNSGLSDGAVGGIAAGIVVALLAIVAVATFVVLRLKRAEKEVKDARDAEYKRESSNSNPQSHDSPFGQPSISEIDSTVDGDPLRMFPAMRSSQNLQSATAVADRASSRVSIANSVSPQTWNMPFNQASSNGIDGRQSSVDSYVYGDGYQTQRVSVSSYGSPNHSRHTSDTSELEGQHGISELSTPVNEMGRSSSLQRPTKTHARRTSDLSGPNYSRCDSGMLGTVNEAHELHGDYGPVHEVAGQTTTNRDPGSLERDT